MTEKATGWDSHLPSIEERCDLCGRTDQDESWLWLEVMRPDDECDFEQIELVFCSQAHAGEYFTSSTIDWHAEPRVDDVGGIRADRFMFGCGLIAIILSAIGLIAVAQWIF